MLNILFLTNLFQPQDYGNLMSVLLWLAAGPGAVAAAMWIVSYTAESWSKWHTVPSQVKRLAAPTLAIVFAVTANLIIQQAPYIIETIQPWWAIIITVILGWFASLHAHKEAYKSGVSMNAKNKV